MDAMNIHEMRAKLAELEAEEAKAAEAQNDVEIAEVVEEVANNAIAEIESKTAEVAEQITPEPTVPTQFGSAMEKVKLDVLTEAAADDEKFVETVKDNLKSAAIGNTQVEQKRAAFEKQKVDFASETLATAQQKNAHKAAEDKWENREKRRQYHYNGVKPIMQFVGINDPLNLFLLYLLTFILSPFYLLHKLLKGTLGVLISGACNEDRGKAVRRFLWTLIAIISLGVIAAIVYLFLKWQGLI